MKYQLNSDAVSAELMTATPVERSNSPPIISSDTPTAMIPIVELPYRMVAKALGWVNVGETSGKEDEKHDRADERADLGAAQELLDRACACRLVRRQRPVG